MPEPIPFLDLRAAFRELAVDHDAAWRRVAESAWFVLGSEGTSFEAEFAAYCGVAHAVGVGNGLDALHLILRAAGVGPGDEVIVPAHTFIATWLAVSHAGAVPVGADVLASTGNLDPAAVRAAITPRTRAIVAVHLYGQPADMGELGAIASRHSLLLVEDAAQAHGARHDGRRAGSLAQAAGFSFYPGKNLGGCGDGGAIVSDDSTLIERVRMLRNYGSRVKYEHESIGFNTRLDEVQAAWLRVRLPHLDAWNQRRRQIAALYTKALQGLLRLPEVPSFADPVWHLYVVRHPRRQALMKHLSEAGIQTLIHYPTTPHLSPAYSESGAGGVGAFPCAEQWASEALSLPIGPHLSLEDAGRVAAAIRSFFGAP